MYFTQYYTGSDGPNADASDRRWDFTAFAAATAAAATTTATAAELPSYWLATLCSSCSSAS